MAEQKKHTFECPDVPKTIFKYFEALKNKKEFCDITLLVGGESISAHQIIITAVIPYFRDILTSETHQKDVSIPNVDPNALKCLIQFAYTLKIDIDAENVSDLLAAACYLGVDAVRDACCDFLVDILEHDNVMNIRELAVSLNCTELLKCTECYIKRNFEQVSQTKGFLQCPSTFLKELIGKDDMSVDGEEKVLEAVINWVKISPKERSSELPELMRKVRMPLLDPLFLTKTVEREEIIRTSVSCRDLIDEAKNYVLYPELRNRTCSFVTESRDSTKTMNTMENNSHSICALSGQLKFTAMHFDAETEEWHTKETHTYLLERGKLVKVHKKMYYFFMGSTIEYNLDDNGYKTLNGMPTPRLYATATALRSQIYVSGGEIGLVPLKAVECFDPKQNKWTSVRCMKISCWGASSVTLGEYIYVMCGRDCTSIYDTVQRYDSVMDKWKVMSSLLTKRIGAGAATSNGKIYICGGFVPKSGTISLAASDTAEVYDPIQNRSTLISRMSNARSDLSLVPCNGKLYALGGRDNKGRSMNFFNLYNPESNEWTHGGTVGLVSGAVCM